MRYIDRASPRGTQAVGFSALAARALGPLAPLAAALCRQSCAALPCCPCCPPCGRIAERPDRLWAPFSAALRLPARGAAIPGLPRAAAEPPQAEPVAGPSESKPMAEPPQAGPLAEQAARPAAPEKPGVDILFPAPPDGAFGGREIQPEASESMNTIDRLTPSPDEIGEAQPDGLLRYKKWWFLRHVDVSVGGELLSGTPIFTEGGVMRLAGERHSYFIPMDKIDYIRTGDGLDAGSAPAM